MSPQTLPSSSKKTYEHLVYRYAFCGSVLVCGVSGIWFLCESSGYPVALLVFIPCSLFNTFAAFNAIMFPWRYSVFGPDRKTPRPPGRPIIALQPLTTRIGRCRAALVTSYFYTAGVAISTGIGDAWIPFTDVRRIERRGKWIVIVHDCEEVRSPIEISTAFMAAERVDEINRFLEESMSVEMAELATPTAVPMRRRRPTADGGKKSVVFKIMGILYRIARVVFALALGSFTAYSAISKYQHRKLFDACFLAIFAIICIAIAGLTVWWGIPGRESRPTDDA